MLQTNIYYHTWHNKSDKVCMKLQRKNILNMFDNFILWQLQRALDFLLYINIINKYCPLTPQNINTSMH